MRKRDQDRERAEHLIGDSFVCSPVTGEVFGSTEVLTVRDGRIVEAHVFFGGRVDG